MTPEIERLAKEAGVMVQFDVFKGDVLYSSDLKVLAKFAALIAEECAELAEKSHSSEQCWFAIRSKFPMPAQSSLKDAAK